jgi:redox-sensitive bicupin YhaK (pirin superfamily)
LGEPARVAQNDRAALSGGEVADIPAITDDDGVQVRIVCGTFWGSKGPVDGIAADPIYLDVTVPPGRRKSLPVETTRHAFAYVFAGAGKFCNASGPLAVPTEGVGWADTSRPAEADNRSLVLFDRGDEVTVEAGPKASAFCWCRVSRSRNRSPGMGPS